MSSVVILIATPQRGVVLVRSGDLTPMAVASLALIPGDRGVVLVRSELSPRQIWPKSSLAAIFL